MNKNQRGNDILLLILSCIFVTYIFISNNIHIYVGLCILSLVNILLMRNIKIKYLLIFSICMLPTTIGMFVSALIFAKSSSGTIISFWGMDFTSNNLELAINLSLRTFCLSWVSFLFIIHVNFTNCVLYAMQYLKLPVKIGYALLAMINAMAYIKQEFIRIRIAQKMRGLAQYNLLHLMYPLMISASRYAYVCGISLESRGLNSDKSFVRQVASWKNSDSLILLINILIISLLLSLYNYNFVAKLLMYILYTAKLCFSF